MNDFLNEAADDLTKNPDAGRDTSRDPIPDGKYTFLIADAKESPYVFGAYKDEDMAAMMAADTTITPGSQFRFKFECMDPDYQGKVVYDDMVTQPASNHQTFGKLTPEVLVKINKTNFRALVKRAGVSGEVLQKQGLAALLNRVVELPIIVKVKGSKKRNTIEYAIKEGEVINAPKMPEGVSRPAASDEAPF